MKSAGDGNTSRWLWLGVPLLIIIAQTAVEIFVPDQYMVPFHTEGGPIETIQFFTLLLCVAMSAYLVLRVEGALLKVWVGCALLGSIYIAGEEVSWGQHIIGWDTPEFWQVINDQQETNLHNTSSWLDQKPRALMFIGIVVGGLIIPALRRWKPESLPARFESIYPKDMMIPVSLGVLLVYMSDNLWKVMTGERLFARSSEVQELYIYYFIFLYLLGLRDRIIPKSNL